jgi:hypothetical protein
MSKTESAIKDLQAKGFDNNAILDALCDGSALEYMGLDDDDQTDIEEAFYK